MTSRSGKVISADTLARLEQLDDTMFEALSGDPHALDHSKAIWRSAQHAVSPQLLDESRDQYVRYAERVWRSYESRPEQNLPQAFAALEILTILAE